MFRQRFHPIRHCWSIRCYSETKDQSCCFKKKNLASIYFPSANSFRTGTSTVTKWRVYTLALITSGPGWVSQPLCKCNGKSPYSCYPMRSTLCVTTGNELIRINWLRQSLLWPVVVTNQLWDFKLQKLVLVLVLVYFSRQALWACSRNIYLNKLIHTYEFTLYTEVFTQ